MAKKEEATEAKTEAPKSEYEVSAKKSDDDRVVTAKYKFGANLAESTALFGDHTIYSKFVQSAVIDLQSLMRRLLKTGKTDEEIQTEVSGWKPGAKTTVRKSGKEKALDALGSLSAEDRKEILAKYS